MEVEKTLERIAASQLQAEKAAEARAREFDGRMAKADHKAEERYAQAMKRMDRADKQIEATRNLVRAGMKMVVSIQKAQKETEHKLNALIDSQIRTDGAMRKSEEKFNRLLEKLSFKRSNRHN